MTDAHRVVSVVPWGEVECAGHESQHPVCRVAFSAGRVSHRYGTVAAPCRLRRIVPEGTEHTT